MSDRPNLDSIDAIRNELTDTLNTIAELSDEAWAAHRVTCNENYLTFARALNQTHRKALQQAGGLNTRYQLYDVLSLILSRLYDAIRILNNNTGGPYRLAGWNEIGRRAKERADRVKSLMHYLSPTEESDDDIWANDLFPLRIAEAETIKALLRDLNDAPSDSLSDDPALRQRLEELVTLMGNRDLYSLHFPTGVLRVEQEYFIKATVRLIPDADDNKEWTVITRIHDQDLTPRL